MRELTYLTERKQIAQINSCSATMKYHAPPHWRLRRMSRRKWLCRLDLRRRPALRPPAALKLTDCILVDQIVVLD